MLTFCFLCSLLVVNPDSTGRFSHNELVEYAQTYGTPLYVYDGDLIAKKYQKFYRAFQNKGFKVKVHYAVKANTNISIIALLKREGAAAECISQGEIQIALKLGYTGNDILFTSSSKSREELAFAVKHNVTINLDSLDDLANLSEVCRVFNAKARVSFRINPDIDPKTHRHISTGHKFSKFGILFENDEIIEAYRRAEADPNLVIVGIHSHIGSQILDMEPFERNVSLVTQAVQRLKKELGIELKFINLGGGLGIPYRDGKAALEPAAVAPLLMAKLKEGLDGIGYQPELWFEPGRYFVADAGFLVAQINSVKRTPHRNFININTGFNHLARPILYEAYHRVRVLNGSGELSKYDVAGNICETGDILATDRFLPEPKRGGFVAILDVGAYGYSMSSEYNSFLLPAEILVRGKRVDLIRKRETFEQLLRNQVLCPFPD